MASKQVVDVVTVNGVDYVRADLAKMAETPEGPYVIVRSRSAGVFAAVLVQHDVATGTVELANARRLWYWNGAASLSQLAVEGVSKPKECKFPVAVPTLTVGEVIEVIPATEKARESVESVPVWQA